MSYELVPGTVPHRAVEFLRTLPAGTELSTAQLADSIDADSRSLTISLQTVRKNGVLTARRAPDGRGMVWSLGDGTPPGCEVDDDEDGPLPAKTPAPPPPLSARSIFDAALTPDAPRTAQDWLLAAAAGADAPEQAAEPAAPAPVWPAYREPVQIPDPTFAEYDITAEEIERITAKPSPAVSTTTAGPRFALWSEGALQIEREGAAPVVLAREETKALIDYLDVMHGREVAA